MEYWTEIYKEIADKITENLPEIRWCDLWHEQINYLTEELPFPTPAVFLSFNTLNTQDKALLVQDCNLQIDMYLYYETFSDTYSGSYNQENAFEFLDELTKLHALFHGKNGQNYSAMRRTDMRREDSGGAGNLYRISFECLITDYSAQILFVDQIIPQAEVNLIKSKNIEVPGNGTKMYDIEF
jgi:hypothetical protein